MVNCSGTCVAIGNFDGIHKGHDVLIRKMIEIGVANKLKTIILTFKFVDKSMRKNSCNMNYLSTYANKITQLKEYNCDYVESIELNNKTSMYSPEQFIKEILIDKYNVKHVVVGYNFRFGYKASGNVQNLVNMSEKYDYSVTIVDKVISDKGEVISSTMIRELIKNGDISQANYLLRDNYTIFKNELLLEDDNFFKIKKGIDIVLPLDGKYQVTLNNKIYEVDIINKNDDTFIYFNENVKLGDIIFNKCID